VTALQRKHNKEVAMGVQVRRDFKAGGKQLGPKMRRLAVLLALPLLLVSCATTKVNSVWKDDAFQKQVSKVLVIGIIRNPTKKRMFEQAFARALKERGADAVEGYAVLPADGKVGREALEATIKKNGIDGVLISRLVDKKTVATYVPGTTYMPPPYYNGWGSYYDRSYAVVYNPGYTVNDEFAVIETNLYDANSGKLVWSVSSDTHIASPDADLIKSFVKVMVESLEKSQILK